jgi:hypothetical protein
MPTDSRRIDSRLNELREAGVKERELQDLRRTEVGARSPEDAVTSNRRRRVLALVLVIAAICASETSWARGARGGGGSVSVRGYVRKDGTYVAPHYRSAPDGNFDNNWSTKGNINPYTGEEGTRVTPPSGYSGGASSTAPSPGSFAPYGGDRERQAAPQVNADESMRSRKAADLQRLGYTVDWRRHSWSEMQDWEIRIRKAGDLSRMGIAVKWQDRSWTEMQDWEMRIRKANELRALGLSVNWQQHSWSEMQDWEIRIRKANELRVLGVAVDWRQYTWTQLFDMKRGIEAQSRALR